MNLKAKLFRGNDPGQIVRRCVQYLVGAVLLFAVGASAASAQTVPAATASASRQLLASFTNPVIGHMGTNSNGDLFYVNSAYSGSAILYQLPRGTTTPVQIATGFSGARNVYVDSANNLYVPNAYSGNILEVPYVNGGYATGITISGSTPSCNSYTPAVPCYQFGSVGAVGGYYYQPLDLGMDAQGNAYILNAYANGSCAGNCILKFTKNNDSAGGYTPSVVKSNITAQNYNAQIAVDPAGDIFYEAGGSVLYAITAGGTNPVSFGTNVTSVAGVSTDRYGNLYITNSSTPYAIYEFPAVNGTVATGTQFSLIGTYSGNGPAVDTLGDVYYTGYNNGTTLNVANVNGIPLGRTSVGTAVAKTAASVTFTFGAGGTVSSISATGAGFTYAAGSCAAGTYRAGDTCTVNVNYTPTAVGLQRGAITLNGANGALAAALLSGIGDGALQTNDPATVTAIGGGFTSPRNVALDPAGNVYVADPGQNAVLQFVGGTGTPNRIGSGLNAPTAVAVDNAGNVYIADAGNSRIVQVPNINGTLTSSAQTVIYSGSSNGLNGIALDFAGNLYVADSSAKSITELLNIGGLPRSANRLTLGTLTGPTAVATDLNGNLLVADGNSVVRIAYVGRAQSTVSSAFSKPTGLALDAAGSVYVADNGNGRLVRVPLEGTAYNTNDQNLVGATVATPYGVAVDSNANLYVVDNAAASVSLLNRTSGLLPLGRVQIPQSSAAQNATLGNAGTTALTFGTPLYTAVSTTPTYFLVTAPSGNGCATGASLATSFSCVLSATFTPATTGSFSDVLTFTSNALNAPKTLTLTGTGVNLAADTITLTASPATPAFGSVVTVQAAITSSVAGTPTGSVSFTLDGNAQGRASTLNGSGVASITLTGLTGGPHQVCGNYSGDDNFRPSNTCITVTVAKVATVTTLAIKSTGATPLTTAVGDTATLTATVAAGAATPPTGTVTFTAGSTNLGTVALAASQTGFTAVLATKNLPAGNTTVTATYNGDVNYTASSGSIMDVVTYPTIVVTPATNNLTVGKVGSGTVTLTVTSLGGFAGNVALSCSGLPANTICSFSPNAFTLAADQPQTITLQVLTGQTPVVKQPLTGALVFERVGGLLACILVPFGLAAHRRASTATGKALLSLVLVLLLGSGATALTGCGSSQFFGDTPTGTSNVTISATGTTPTAALVSSGSTYGYSGYASGCAPATAGSTTVNCTETATLSLVVQ